MSTYLDRTLPLVGDEAMEKISNAKILVVGLGGVGGTAFEALVRSGFKHFTLIDSDDVDITNLNRQILFTGKDVGKSKVEIAKEKAESISKNIDIIIYKAFLDKNFLNNCLGTEFDFVVDAIDSVTSKLDLYEFALANNIPFITSLGMGNRLDPSKVVLTTLDKTENDPLARKMRSLCRQKGIDLKKINVVISKETPKIKSIKPYSMMMVPSEAGLLMCFYILNNI